MTGETIFFGAGCFWGVEDYFSKINGVVETAVGYMGGHTDKPTYSEVCTDTTGHAEVTKIVFDPEKVSFKDLLTHFFKIHDSTTPNRQPARPDDIGYSGGGPDVGSQYRSAIFFTSPEQEQLILEKIKALNRSGQYLKPIVTEVVSAPDFYRAEEYHQKYVEKNGVGACHIQP